ncbi:hypothetical protein MRQ36_13675 [Micromonospora sp. R77]|uniref:hypothetical protein n=1 Tax=Micromonospora sp. R77 TaxID=2925836 RepID=UPI001F607CDD|nr:hypothetical protein [Micromonospora sp. R77]MCI4063576.1 hypothetical protein [Micromonospora sp. R77]
MSYPDRAPARRPAAVVAAAALLVLMALGAVAYAVIGLAALDGTVDRFRAAANGTGATGGEVDGVVSLLRVSGILAAVVTVLVGLVLVGLALGLLAGRPGARVTTWVVCGLGLLCGCGALGVLVVERTAPLRLGTDQRVTADLLARAGDAYPSWWIPLNAAASVGQLLGYLVVAALLTLPAARAWFRRGAAPAGPVPTHGPGSTPPGPWPGSAPAGHPPPTSSPYAPPASAVPPASGPAGPPGPREESGPAGPPEERV